MKAVIRLAQPRGHGCVLVVAEAELASARMPNIGLDLLYLAPGATGGMEVYARALVPRVATQWPEARPRLILNKAEILFAHPVGDAAERVFPVDTGIQRFPVSIGLHLGGYHVQGTLHLPDRVAWEQYLTALRDRFLALTGVTITRAVDGTTVGTAASAAVNRERLSVLYEQ